MTFLELAKERYSCRKFSDETVPAEVINKILDSAVYAPTAHNYQPQHIYVLQSEEALSKIRELTPCHFDAKLIFIICSDEDLVWRNPMEEGYVSDEIDASIVATHMVLAGYEEGVGSCMVRMFNAPAVKEAFSLPENIRPVLLIPMGIPAPEAHPAKIHFASRTKEEMVEYI